MPIERRSHHYVNYGPLEGCATHALHTENTRKTHAKHTRYHLVYTTPTYATQSTTHPQTTSHHTLTLTTHPNTTIHYTTLHTTPHPYTRHTPLWRSKLQTVIDTKLLSRARDAAGLGSVRKDHILSTAVSFPSKRQFQN